MTSGGSSTSSSAPTTRVVAPRGRGSGCSSSGRWSNSAGGTAWAGNRPTGGAEFGFRIPAYVEDDDLLDEE